MKLLKKSVSTLLIITIVFSMLTIIPFEAFAAGIDVNSWSAIQNAINGGSSTITLAADVTAESNDSALTVDSGKNITIDLNGHMLSRGLASGKNNGQVFRIDGGGTLTVTDSADDGVITGGVSSDDTKDGGIYNVGTLNLQSGDITGNVSASKGGGGIANYGTLNISGGSISNNTA